MAGKCRISQCGSCCYECEDYSQCNNNCKEQDPTFQYKDCLFYLNDNNKRVAKIDILTDED